MCAPLYLPLSIKFCRRHLPVSGDFASSPSFAHFAFVLASAIPPLLRTLRLTPIAVRAIPLSQIPLLILLYDIFPFPVLLFPFFQSFFNPFPISADEKRQKALHLLDRPKNLTHLNWIARKFYAILIRGAICSFLSYERKYPKLFIYKKNSHFSRVLPRK